MLVQIAVGTCLLVVNIIIAAVAAMVLEVIFQAAHPWLMREPHRPKLVVLLAGVSLWVLGVVTAGVWVWATALFELEWRLLAGMEAANGFLNFGLLTALLIEALRQIRLGQFEHKRKGG